MCGCCVSLPALESDLLPLKVLSASTAATEPTTAATSRTTPAAATASETAAATATKSTTVTESTAATATAATPTAAPTAGETSVLPRRPLASVVEPDSAGTPALANVRTILGIERRLRILDGVEAHVAKALPVSGLP